MWTVCIMLKLFSLFLEHLVPVEIDERIFLENIRISDDMGV